MFKPVAFDPYGRRRSRWKLPRWLVLIVLGMAIGVGGVIYVQERYLGPRLSLSASNDLRRSFEEADAARSKLKTELDDASKRLGAALAEKKGLTDELASSRSGVKALQDDLTSVVASLPPDPRGGAVQVRAGWLVLKNGAMTYDIVLTRERSPEAPIAGAVQFVVTGETLGGSPKTATLTQVPVSIGGQQVVRGVASLPGDFKPLQANVQILERASGKVLGMRVLLIK